jgi:hypothetical protein
MTQAVYRNPGTSFSLTPGGRSGPPLSPVRNELQPVAPPAAAAPADPFGMFDDPATNFFTHMLGDRINALQAPVSDPTRDSVMALFGAAIPRLMNTAPLSVGYGGNPLLGDLVNSGRQRITELNQEPFSAGEEAAMRARASDTIEQMRTASRTRALEDTARLGQARTSGTMQARLADADRTADGARAESANTLMLAIAQERQRRRDQAVSIAQSLAAAGQSEAGMQMQGQGLQLQAQGQAFGQQNQALGLASTLAALSGQQRQEEQQRQSQAVGYAGMLADLPMQRLQSALGVLNGTGGSNPSSILNGLGQLSGLQTNANQNAQQQQAAMLAGLGQILGYVGQSR